MNRNFWFFLLFVSVLCFDQYAYGYGWNEAVEQELSGDRQRYVELRDEYEPFKELSAAVLTPSVKAKMIDRIVEQHRNLIPPLDGTEDKTFTFNPPDVIYYRLLSGELDVTDEWIQETFRYHVGCGRGWHDFYGRDLAEMGVDLSQIVSVVRRWFDYVREAMADSMLTRVEKAQKRCMQVDLDFGPRFAEAVARIIPSETLEKIKTDFIQEEREHAEMHGNVRLEEDSIKFTLRTRGWWHEGIEVTADNLDSVMQFDLTFNFGGRSYSKDEMLEKYGVDMTQFIPIMQEYADAIAAARVLVD